MKEITSFRGKYAFLSNFYECDVPFNGTIYRSAESAFQAQKCPEYAKEFQLLSAKEAKAISRKIKLRSDWDQVRTSIMYQIIYSKFYYNEELRQKLLDTGDRNLIEGNTWGDTYWGVCNGIGENYLGRILMLVRDEFRNK